MKRSALLLTLLGTILPHAPAAASDLGVPPEFRPSTFDIYLGTFGNAAVLASSYREAGIVGSRRLDGTEIGWGVRAGTDYVMGEWVFGAVADLTFGGETAEGRGDLSLEMPMLGTIRARAGGKWGDSLIYVTGGHAQAEMKLVEDKFSDTTWTKGWTIGAGVDYALNDQFSVGLEYLFIGLNDLRYGPNDKYRHDVEGIHSIRLGIDYHFHI